MRQFPRIFPGLLKTVRRTVVCLPYFLVSVPGALCANTPGTWARTQPLTVSREFYAAVVLGNGKALITGGTNGSFLATAELYDPASGAFSPTGSMAVGRELHTATLLPDGTVLITGGVTPSGPTSEAEIYDPSTGTFKAVGSMTLPRDSHTATLVNVQAGIVLITGGEDAQRHSLASAEIYNPQTQTFTAVANLQTPRKFHTATCFESCQRVLIAGGDDNDPILGDSFLRSAEIFDFTKQPAVSSFTSQMEIARVLHTATLLDNGNILLAGGDQGASPIANTAEVFSPTTLSFAPVRGTMSASRQEGHSAIPLNNGLGAVLIAGGDDGNGNTTNTADIYIPLINSLSPANKMIDSRTNFTLLALPNGQILAAGGGQTSPVPRMGFFPIPNAELYTPFELLQCPTCGHPITQPPRFPFPALSFCQEFPLACHGVLLSESSATLWGALPNSIVYMPFPRFAGPSSDLRARKLPIYYHIVIEGIGENWAAGVFDSGANPIPATGTLIPDGLVLTLVFRNVAELEKTMSRSLLALQMMPKAVPGQQYKATIHVEVSDREYYHAETKAKP
jgi:hypothetical protein